MTTQPPNKTQFKDTILDALPSKLINEYMSKGLLQKQTFSKNEILHLEGELCKQIEIILSGEIVVQRIGLEGDLMIINHFTRGDIIGANLIFSSTARYPMTISTTRQTEVLTIQKDTLFELCNQHPEFLMQFIRIISDVTVLIGTKMKNRISRTIRQSIITYINKQYQTQNSLTIALNLSKKSLAELFGVSRTSLSRELQKMKDEGLITFDAKTIHVISPDLIKE